MAKIPFEDLLNATLQALHRLDGSGRNQEIHNEAVGILELSDAEVAKPRKPGQSNPTEIAYRLGWARTYLRRYGLIENSSRGVWALTAQGLDTKDVDGKEVERAVNKMLLQEKRLQAGSQSLESDDSTSDIPEAVESAIDEGEKWRDVLDTTLREMDPIAFERLCQRLLRESGFTRVEVTQASHDGGIDGKGILQVNDFLSFRVVFQCKRYSGSVGPDVVQKLRGAMPGSADRGLIVTTGHFTQGAIKEASHEHKSPIELVDGEELLNRLKALELGVSTEMVEKVTVDPDFFANI